MITDEEFDQRMHELFQQLGDRVSTASDPRSILDRRGDPVRTSGDSAPSVRRRGRWIAMVAAASLVGLGVVVATTREDPVHRVTPAVATDGVDDSDPTAATVSETAPPTTLAPTEPLVTTPSTASIVLVPADPYGDVAAMLQAAQDVSYRAMVKAVTECMRRQGYTYHSVPDPSSDFSKVLTNQPWNTPTPEMAASRGYLRPRQGDPVVNPDGDTGFGNSAYQHALYGDVIDNWELPPGETVPPGFAVGGPIMDGCRPAAQTQIVGDGDPRKSSRIVDYYTLMQLSIAAPARTIAIPSTPAYGRAVTAWATCMHDHGYDYADPSEPRNKSWPGPRPGSAEIAAATQDASCKDETGLTKLGDQLFGQIASDWFIKNPDRYAEISDFVKGVTDRANTILAS